MWPGKPGSNRPISGEDDRHRHRGGGGDVPVRWRPRMREDGRRREDGRGYEYEDRHEHGHRYEHGRGDDAGQGWDPLRNDDAGQGSGQVPWDRRVPPGWEQAGGDDVPQHSGRGLPRPTNPTQPAPPGLIGIGQNSPTRAPSSQNQGSRTRQPQARQRVPQPRPRQPHPIAGRTNRTELDQRSAFIVGIAATAILIGVLVALLWVFSGTNKPVPEATPLPNGGAEPVAPVPDLDGISIGNLISDAEFFDADAMTLEQVESFINTWNTGCRTGADGTVCLTEYREDTPTWQADGYCEGTFQGASGDSAANIIWKAAKACDINPKVILTTLQKEQGLITASGRKLTGERYSIAMGYACPDGAHCDPKYYGFAKQVYWAANQFQRYRLEPEEYSFKAEQVNDIPYHVNAECGSAPVYIENQATAGLYNYTPYQPSPSTLAGHNDGCSTWGNMNFYGFYRAWFGDTE